MAPEVIVIPQPEAFGAGEFRESLLSNEALAEVPAIKNGRVYVVESKHFTTLSYWNIRGAEDLARLLWPDAFPDPPATTFSSGGVRNNGKRQATGDWRAGRLLSDRGQNAA